MVCFMWQRGTLQVKSRCDREGTRGRVVLARRAGNSCCMVFTPAARDFIDLDFRFFSAVHLQLVQIIQPEDFNPAVSIS